MTRQMPSFPSPYTSLENLFNLCYAHAPKPTYAMRLGPESASADVTVIHCVGEECKMISKSFTLQSCTEAHFIDRNMAIIIKCKILIYAVV